MLDNRLGKDERIYLRSELQQLFASRGSFVSYPFRVIYKEVPLQDHPLKVMISIPKKRIKLAVDRNRLKRLTKEAIRLHKDKLTDYLSRDTTLLIGFIYLKERMSKYTTIERAVCEAFTKLSPESNAPIDHATPSDTESD